MSVNPESEPSLIIPEDEMPRFVREIRGTEYDFGWDNTFVRRFHVGDGQFDHIIHRLEPDSYVCIFGWQTPPDLLPELIDSRFPTAMDPILDAQTIDFYAKARAKELETSTISDLLGEDESESGL